MEDSLLINKVINGKDHLVDHAAKVIILLITTDDGIWKISEFAFLLVP